MKFIDCNFQILAHYNGRVEVWQPAELLVGCVQSANVQRNGKSKNVIPILYNHCLNIFTSASFEVISSSAHVSWNLRRRIKFPWCVKRPGKKKTELLRKREQREVENGFDYEWIFLLCVAVKGCMRMKTLSLRKLNVLVFTLWQNQF